MWRDLIDNVPPSKYRRARNAAVESLKAQNQLLDSVYDVYIA
jgi:hypothetical protein